MLESDSELIHDIRAASNLVKKIHEVCQHNGSDQTIRDLTNAESCLTKVLISLQCGVIQRSNLANTHNSLSPFDPLPAVITSSPFENSNTVLVEPADLSGSEVRSIVITCLDNVRDKASFGKWLTSSKLRWSCLWKREKRKKVFESSCCADRFNLDQTLRTSAQQAQPSCEPRVQPSQPFEKPSSVLLLQLSNIELNLPSLLNDRLNIAGFIRIAQVISQLHPAEVSMSLLGNTNTSEWSSMTQGNPSYSYLNIPLPGWRKDICVQMGGKGKGSLEVAYIPPDGKKRLKGKRELDIYCQQSKFNTDLLSRFDHSQVYCVCNKPECNKPEYVQCSFGKAGCNEWVHASCVGLGHINIREIESLPNIICPLCAMYLDGTGEITQFSGYM